MDTDISCLQPPAKKLRSACDRCHLAKSKCQRPPGASKCLACSDSDAECIYSVQNRAGRPKGARNKRTLGQTSTAPPNIIRATTNPKPMSTEFDELACGLEQPSTPHLPQSQSFLRSPPVIYDGVLNEMVPRSESLDDLSIPADSNDLWGLPYSNFSPAKVDRRQQSAFGNGMANNSLDVLNASTASLESPQTSFDDLPSMFFAPHMPCGNTGTTTPRSSIASTEHYSSAANDADNYSSMPSRVSTLPSAPATPRTIDSPAICSCFQQHADLLCLLKNLEHECASSSIEVVLMGIKQASKPWQSFINCTACQHENNDGGLLLSIISIRMVVRRLQSICADNEIKASMQDSSAHGISPTLAAEKVLIGNYEASCHEQRFVTDILAMRALGQIKTTLFSLKEKLDDSTSRNTMSYASHYNSPDSQTSQDSNQVFGLGSESDADVGYARGLLQNLEVSVYTIGNSLRARNAKALQECRDGC